MRLIFTLVVFLFTTSLFAQTPELAYEDEMIKIEYQILEVKKKKEMVGEIRLIVTNKTEHYLLLDFTLSIFYEMTMVEQ